MTKQTGNIQVSSAFIVLATCIAACAFILPAADAQFMSHRIDRTQQQERTAQKLWQHIMELELPIRNHRQAPVRDSRINMNRRHMGTTEASVDLHTTAKSRGPTQIPIRMVSVSETVIDSAGDKECNPNSSSFNMDGYDCICDRTSSGQVLCKKQQHPNGSPDKLGRDDQQAVFMMLNNFEKLVDAHRRKGNFKR